MKKYIPNLLSFAFAIILSAFTTNNFSSFTYYTLKLTRSPTSPGVVSDETKWSECGVYYGRCETASNDLACSITAHDRYTHDEQGCQVLNTPWNTPLGEAYLIITETQGVFCDEIQYYRILSIVASDLTSDFTFFNGDLPCYWGSFKSNDNLQKK